MDKNEKTLPPISRDSSKQTSNKLARRLYKNNSMKKLNNTAEFSYLRNINPDSSILAGGNLSKSNSSKNLLIPSVSLKRNKEHDMSQRSLQITHGKVLLSSPKNQEPTFLHYKGDLKSQLHKSSTKALFKKLNRYDGINEKKIIPDELLGCSSDQEESKLSKYETILNADNTSPKNSLSKGAKILKGLKNQSSKINQDDEPLTPNDFIQLVQEDGSISNEFCYLKKMSHAYDLRIVEFQASTSANSSNPNRAMTPSMLQPTDEYITISSRGVSYFSQQNSRFVPLERWKREEFYFNKLMKLEFFSKYRLFKNFAKWKKHIRKTAMKSTTDKLRNELMIGDKFLRKALLSVKDSCFVMESDTNYCKFDDCQSVMQFSAFKSCQQQFIQNEFEKRILEIEEDIKNNLINNMSDSMREFKEQNKISTSNQSKGIPLLIGDEKNLDMPYTKEATLRIQQEKFKKFLKLVEFMIVDSKIKMMSESTQKIVKKVQEQNETYERQVIDTKYKYLFKGKQYIKCAVKINVDEQIIQLKPTREDLNYMFEEIVNRTIVKLCRNHKRIINDDQILQIIYDSNDKIVKQPETNILKVIIMGDDRQEKIVNALNLSINTTYSFLEIYSNRFSKMVQMYFDNVNKLNAISTYEAKDHQIVKNSLEKWKNQLLEINTLSQQHEAAIFLLDFQQFKNNAIRCVSQCLEKTKRVMPDIYLSTTKTLLIQLSICQQKMKVKPVHIEDFIEFQKNKSQITAKMDDYADRLSEISCMWINIKENCSSSEVANISKQQQQQQLGKPQHKLNLLRTLLEEAEMNSKTYENNAQELLKSKIPLVKDEIYKLYNNKMKTSKFDVNSRIQQVSQAIEQYQSIHDHIAHTIKKIKEFQLQLSMEDYNEETMPKFSVYFSIYKNIWKLHQALESYKQEIMDQLWTTIDIDHVKKQVDYFFNEALKLKKQITTQSADDEQFKVQLNDIDVLSYVFLEAKNLKPLIQIVQCLRDKSLLEKEWKQIKSYFERINKQHVCSLIDIENKEATIKNIQEHKISEELDFIQSIVYRSKKQLQIQNKISSVNRFWSQKTTDNAVKSLTEKFQVLQWWDIIMEIDEKISLINEISEDSEVQGPQIKQSITANKNLFDSLRVLMSEWEIHQGYMFYFKPIFENPYWKSNPKEHKIYTQACMNWAKLIKQGKQFTLKKWATQKKNITIIKDNISLLEQLKKSVEDFLNVKRDIFPKFYFLSNEELLHVLQSDKEIRSIEDHLSMVFTCIKSLEMKQLNQILVSTDSQSLIVKFSKAINNFEVEEIIKMLEEGIKTAIKSNLRSCLANFEKDDFNKKKWIKDHLLQSLLFIQKSQYTKIIEEDYMDVVETEDLSQYLIYQNSQIKELQSFLREYPHEPELSLGKIQTLIIQELLHREITEMLLKNHIIQKDSYEWQSQIRCYHHNSQHNIESFTTKFLVNEVDYGFEFVNLQGAYPYMMFSEKETIEFTMALKLKHSPVIKGRQNLIYNFSKFNAKYYRSILCDKKLSQKYITNVCFGAYLEGCFVEFQQAEKLRPEQISVAANFLKQIYSTLQRKDRTFNFGWKRNNLNIETIYAGVVFKLSDTSNVTNFVQNLPLDHKTIEFKTLPYGLYVNLIMEIKKKNNKQIGSKLMKFIDLIHDVEGYRIIGFQHIRNLLKQQKIRDVQNLETYFVKQILEIVSEHLVSIKKIAFYRQILFDIFFTDKASHDQMSESISQNVKVVKDKSDFKYVVNSLVESTDKKSICVIAGPTQSGKFSVINEAYKQRICRGFQIEVLNVDMLNEESLFGCYINDLWKEGILVSKIKQLSLSKEEWFVFEGSYSQKTLDIIHRLNHHYLQLSNGETVFLSKRWKFMFSIYNLDQNANNIPKNVDIIQSTSFINIKDSIQLMTEKRIKPHFEKDSQNKNLQNFGILYNKCGSRDLNRDLKIPGAKSDYLRTENVLRYFINTLDALLSSIPFEIKLSKEFSKGIEKIFIWALYWCVGSSLPSLIASRYEKYLFENTKSDIECSHNLGLIRIDFDTPAGTLKKFKNPEIKLIKNELYMETVDLKAKAHFIQLMIRSNFPVVLIGKTGSGKSKFMEYLQVTLNPEEFTHLPIRLRKQMSYEDFKEILFKKTRISFKPLQKKCFCSSTNKRLIIFIDDFNILDINCQIGEFIMTCIKNGYYYDTTTNEKIHIQNISFVVAQNDSYESRIDNKFMKYFKPIFINEIEMKEISQIYKINTDHVEYSREIFDKCASLHSQVMIIQSNGQIKSQFPFSHQNAIRVMQCIKDYAQKQMQLIAEGKQKRQNLAKVWAYTSKLEYTSYNMSPQTQQKIEKQIMNLLNLIIQNCNDKPKPIPQFTDFLNKLINKHNLIKADGQHEEYYEYLCFLMSMSQPRNLLTIGEPLPEIIKAEVLQYVAEFHKFDFYYVKNTETLKNIEFKKSLIYISTQKFDELLHMLEFITNNSECKYGRYIIDCPSKTQFSRLIKYVPHVSSMFHLFNKKICRSRILISPQYNEWLEKLQDSLERKFSKREEISIISNLLVQQKQIKKEIQQKKKIACNFVEVYTRQNQGIQDNIKKVDELTLNIKELQQRDEYVSAKKKQVNETITGLRNTKLEDQAEQERVQNINKLQQQVGELVNEGNQIKTKKKQFSQTIAQIQTHNKLSKEVSLKLSPLFSQFLEIKEKIQLIENSQRSIIFCLSLYYFGIKQNNKQYIEFVQQQNQQNVININHILKVIYDINPSDIRQEVLLWVLEDKTIIVKDKNNRFLRSIKKAFPRIRIINQLHSLSNSFKQPIIYTGKYDLQILTTHQLTIITKEDPTKIPQQLKSRTLLTMTNSPQNQRETIKQTLYSQKEKEISYQIYGFQQQIRQVFLQISGDQQKCIKTFIDPNEKDLKKLKNLLYNQSDRLNKLSQSLRSLQTGLAIKYDAIIEHCCLMKRILASIQQNVNYFEFSDKKFEDLILVSMGIKSSGQKTHKKIQQGLISKRSLGRTKSRKQIPPEVIESKMKIESVESSDPLNVPEQQGGQKEVSQQQKQEEVPQNQDNFVEVFQKRMTNELISKIMLALKSEDSLLAYIIFACFMNEHQFNLPFSHRQVLIGIAKKQNLPSENLIDLQSSLETKMQQVSLESQTSSNLLQIIQNLKKIYSAYQEDQNQVIQKLIKFGDYSLNKFYEDLLAQKYNVQILGSRQNILVISNQRQNPFKILQTHILNSIQDNSWCYLLDNQLNSQKIVEMAEKCSINSFIIINNKNPNIFEQLKEIQKQKDYNFHFLYPNQNSYFQFRKNLPPSIASCIEDLTIVYAEDSTFIYKKISETYTKKFTKLYEQKSQIQQLARILFYDEATQLLKNLHKNQFYQGTEKFYTTKVLNEIVVNLKNLSFNQLAKMLVKVCYPNHKEKQLIVIKQAKKIINKKQNMISTFVEFFTKDYQGFEDVVFEGSSFIGENGKTLIDNFSLCSPQQIVNMLVPQLHRKKYPIDNLYFSQKSAKNQQNSLKSFETIFTQEKMLSEIDKILSQLSTNIVLQSQSAKKEKHFYKELIHDEIRCKINGLKRVEQNLKKYRKLLQAPVKILSESTLNELRSLPNFILQHDAQAKSKFSEKSVVEVVQEYVIREQKSIEYLDKLYLSKQSQKNFDPSHFRLPTQFIKYYLYEMNPQVDFRNGEIQARYLTEKDKEAHFDVAEQCKGLLITEITVKNGKFDQNKNTLEPNDKQQHSKISNVHLCFNDREITHLTSSFPVYFNHQKLFHLSIISKVKEESVWKEKLTLQIQFK